METISNPPEKRQCESVRDWLARRPLRDDPQMSGCGSSLTWNEWVEQGREGVDTEACLHELLASEQDPVTRSDIVMAIGYVGGGRSMGLLVDLLKDREPSVVMEAAAALGRIGGQDAVPALIEALNNDDPNVRANACQALGMLNADQAAAALANALRDGDPLVRSAAQVALARSG